MARIEGISIHTTLAGGDPSCTGRTHLCLYFNPHHPRGWRHGGQNFGKTENEYFNPHHPRGWRPGPWRSTAFVLTISIHTTLAGGDLWSFHQPYVVDISIHTTLAGGDVVFSSGKQSPKVFQSTPPSRVATETKSSLEDISNISIHTTLAGGDLSGVIQMLCPCDFNPHHPRGWRQASRKTQDRVADISIHTTLAEWRRQMVRTIERTQMISIHTTLAGGDLGLPGQHRSTPTFQSTPPSRVATS